jgi:predicted CoA-substrate-specific enzyme activase
MSIVAGFDVGSLSTKAVIMKNNKLAGTAIIKSGPKPVVSANMVMKKLLDDTGFAQSDIKSAVGTGYGREKIAFINHAISEISCHSKGARWFVPSARTIIDIGGQDCKVIKLDTDGNISKFITNDKCASGTGRFLDVMAKVMNIDVSELGKLSQKSTQPIAFASICTVWAQADVIKHINSRSLTIEPDIIMTGGVAKNCGVFDALSDGIGFPVKALDGIDPQINGAFGAAIIAREI